MWGIAPIYFKQLVMVPPAEILVHRIVWSCLLLLMLVYGLKQQHKIKAALKSSKTIVSLGIAGLLLATNWLLFIWSVNNNFLLEASLGYFINPLFTVALGAIFLGERLRKWQLIAVAVALIGVFYLVYSYGKPPWIAIVLAISFGLYGLIRKKTPIDSMPGLFVETTLMLPIALIYGLLFTQSVERLDILPSFNSFLLLCAGAVTIAPLLCFNAAARRMQYSTLGFFQYIGPSMMFLMATFMYKEPLSQSRLICFIFVWTALVIFSVESWHHYRKNKKQSRQLAAQLSSQQLPE